MVKRVDKNFTRASRGQGRFFKEGKVSQALGDGEILKKEEGSKGSWPGGFMESECAERVRKQHVAGAHLYSGTTGLNYGAF